MAAVAAAGAAAGSKPLIRGVVFDMDGTLTVPCIDFAEMKRRAGVPANADILDTIESWEDVARREAAYAAIAEVEAEALQRMRVMPGCEQLCAELDARRVPRALITRNVRAGVRHFHDHHLTPTGLNMFSPAITRECEFEYKPSPAALLHICESWGIDPSEAVMVGDSYKDDVVCGNRAGTITVLLDFERRNGYTVDQFSGEERPTHVVSSLTDVAVLLREHYELQPAAAPHGLVLPTGDKT